MAGKLTKQELKEPDKLQIMLAKGLAYLMENKQKIYIASGILAIILLVTGMWTLYSLDYEKSAQQIYARVYGPSVTDTTAAASLYKEVISRYPRSHAAATAHYRLANLYYLQNDFDAAIKGYEAFLKKTSDKNDLKSLAYTGLGYCYESKKDFKNALIYFEKAAGLKVGQVFEGMNNQNIARAYEAMNEPVKALEYYQKALGKNTDPASELLIKRKIATLS